MKYEGTVESLSRHRVPQWFEDEKLGIFIHWGLYSVPGWATPSGTITDVAREKGWRWHFAHNPYAEWYLNTMRIPGSPTAEYHHRTYGADTPYESFRETFDRESRRWNPDEWAELFASVGAGYVVHTSRHSDSFCLWPTANANPTHGIYHAERNIIGEIASAVRRRGMRFGIYYCGGMDWTFETDPVVTQSEVASKIPQGSAYVDYACGHWRELIDGYKPDVMWNDIGWPLDDGLLDLMAYYYNAVPEGIINDRFSQRTIGNEELPGGMLLSQSGPHYDFITPEYSSFAETQTHKWESNRGIGHSFGYNRNETDADYIAVDELIRSFVDIVSKNGNLLLNVGPTSSGEIVALQRMRLEALGRWLDVHREGIHGTRPWRRPGETLADGTEVRYTAKGECVYLFGLADPTDRGAVVLPRDLPRRSVEAFDTTGGLVPVRYTDTGSTLCVDLRGGKTASPVWGLKLS